MICTRLGLLLFEVTFSHISDMLWRQHDHCMMKREYPEKTADMTDITHLLLSHQVISSTSSYGWKSISENVAAIGIECIW